MKYSTEPPPIYARAQEMWGVRMEQGVVFTYGDTCHCLKGWIPDWLVPHEEVHVKQQSLISPAKWWEQYFTDPAFRLEQELEAYRVQYQWICKKHKDRATRFNWLQKMAKDLSGPMYGECVSFYQAVKLIRQ